MSITTADLAKAVGADATRDEEALTRAIAVATAMVDAALNDSWREVPNVIVDECYLRCAVNIYKANATSDGGFLTGADGTGVPGVANDPLQKCWPLIKRHTNRL